jgi:prefoldin subunit 5
LQSTLESIRKRNEELSTSGSSLGSELEQYREISRNLQEENQELKNFIEEREAELA